MPTPGPDNPRQVRVTAKILEWTHDTAMDWGFSVLYETPTNSGNVLKSFDATLPQQADLDQGVNLFLNKISAGSGDFQAVIQALEQKGSVKVLSEPNIVVPCQKDTTTAARPKVGTLSKVPYEAVQPVGSILAQITQFKDTSINLDVAVEDIFPGNYIRMNINTVVNSLSGYISVATNEAGDPLNVPQTSGRTINNTVLIADRTLFITGVLKTTKAYKNSRGVPFFGQIPVLGLLFKNGEHQTNDQELLFVVKPEIIQN